jgi:hypothetical protein
VYPRGLHPGPYGERIWRPGEVGAIHLTLLVLTYPYTKGLVARRADEIVWRVG